MKLSTKEYAALEIIKLVIALMCVPIMQSYAPEVLGWTSFESWIAGIIMSVYMMYAIDYVMLEWRKFLRETSQNETEKEAK